MDTNKDGTLSHKEIINYYTKYMSKDEAEKIATNMDVNHNGLVNYTEFLTNTLNSNILLSENKLK